MLSGVKAKLISVGLIQSAQKFSVLQVGATLTLFILGCLAGAWKFFTRPIPVDPPEEPTVSETRENCLEAYADSISPGNTTRVDRLQRTLNAVFFGRRIPLTTDGKRGPRTRDAEKQYAFENQYLDGLTADDHAFRLSLARTYHDLYPQNAPCGAYVGGAMNMAF